jgi:anti-sigma regulatory factor (Ser/Thr protein kinase)
MATTKDITPKERRARVQGKVIRKFILDSVETHPGDVAAVAAAKFKISRQAVNKHLARLVAENLITATGKTQKRSYSLGIVDEFHSSYKIAPGLAEHDIWDMDVLPRLGGFAKNVIDIWQFCFTEMFNNAVDHSGGTQIILSIKKTAVNTRMLISDNGVGIFKKIQSSLRLADERHAILELAKGKLTTDPKKHSGQGIFFTSRLLDSFDILSGGLFFTHKFDRDRDWLLSGSADDAGTTVFMRLRNDSTRLDETIFAQFSSADGQDFSKTTVPVHLARYGEEKLVSRSQAKKLLAGLHRFQTVVLDFSGVDTIGQAFTDEIFRVFARQHPEMEILAINANLPITEKINAARSDWPDAGTRNEGRE